MLKISPFNSSVSTLLLAPSLTLYRLATLSVSLKAWLARLVLHFPSPLQGWSDRCGTSEFDIEKLFHSNCTHHFHQTRCALWLIKQIKNWLKTNNKHRILLTGRLGTWKTTLIRGLKDNYVPEDDHLLPHTLKVTPYNYDHGGLNFILFDTPGLIDSNNSSNDYEYLKDMVTKNGEPDLLIFAVKMNDAFRDDDADAIGNISNAFGWKIWKKAMFVLTFANKVTSVGHSPKSADSKLYFNKIFDIHYSCIVEALRSNRVHEDVINSISVVPVGLVSQLKIPSDKRGVSWIGELWEEALKVSRAPRKPVEENVEKDEESKSSSGWFW